MARIKKELEGIKRESVTAFEIREEFLRWDNVKTAHDLYDDMEVARMLLDCYDLIGGNFLVWSDQAQLAPPPLYATLRLQHVSQEGWDILQEIKELGGWKQDKPNKRKSRRKQGQVRRILQKKVLDDEDEDLDFDPLGMFNEDPNDDDYNPDEDYTPEDDNVTKAKRPIRQVRRRASSTSSSSTDSSTSSSEEEEESPKEKTRTKDLTLCPKPGNKTAANKDKPAKRKYGTRYSKATKVFECKYCLATETRRDLLYELINHYKSTHMDTSTTAEVSEGSESAEAKAAKEAQEFQLERDATILWRCLDCQDIMKHRDSHKRLHDKNRQPMVCEICGKVLSSRHTWHMHMIRHDAKAKGVQFICKICGKSFPIANSLKNHMKFHSNARPHQCDTCGKGFKTATHLSRHKLIHIEAKPLICSYCGKGFNNVSNFRGHTRIHTGEKPYSCDLCPAAFTHNVSLKSHKKSAHGVDMWKVPTQKCIEVDEETIKTSVTASIADKIEGGEAADGDSKEFTTVQFPALRLQGPVTDLSSSVCRETDATVQKPKKDMPSVAGPSQYRDIKRLTHEDIKPFAIPATHPSVILATSEQPPIIPGYPTMHQQIPTMADYANIASILHRGGQHYNLPASDSVPGTHHQEYWDTAKRTFTKL